MTRDAVTLNSAQGRFRVRLGKNESIGRSLYCLGHYEFDFFRQAVSYLRESGYCLPKGQGCILDIGANMGVICIGALVHNEFSRAIAVEPEPFNFSLLEHNVKLNKIQSSVRCVQYALANERSQLQFELSKDNFGDHRVRKAAASRTVNERFAESNREIIKVDALTLDELLSELPREYAEQIVVVWIDVQGFEAYVFEGGRGVFSQKLPVVCEVWPYGIERAGISREKYCSLARSLWGYFSVLRRGRFIKYPVEMLPYFFEELGVDGAHQNVIFEKE